MYLLLHYNANTYLGFREPIGSKNNMFTNKKKSYYFRKKIIYSNNRQQVTQIKVRNFKKISQFLQVLAYSSWEFFLSNLLLKQVF